MHYVYMTEKKIKHTNHRSPRVEELKAAHRVRSHGKRLYAGLPISLLRKQQAVGDDRVHTNRKRGFVFASRIFESETPPPLFSL